MDQDPITVTVGTGEDTYAAALARAEVLRSLGSDHVIGPERVVLQGETVLARAPAPRGSTLASVLAARGALPVGECVWLGVRVATALATMHRAGLVHGAIDADAVLIDGASLAVVDATLRPPSASAESPADDVAALGVMLADVVRPADRVVLGAWLDPMTAGDPAARPTAAMVAHALVACAQEVPVALPPADVAGALRASAGASADAQASGVRDAAMRLAAHIRSKAASLLPAASVPRDRPRTSMERPVRDSAPGTPRIAPAMLRKPRVRVLIAGAIVACTGVALVAAAVGGGQALAHQGSPGGTAVRSDPVVAAEELTMRRLHSLAENDAAELLSTVQRGSAAAARAGEQAVALESGALSFDGLEGEVLAAELVAETDSGAAVRVTYRTSAHSVTSNRVVSSHDALTEVALLDLVLERGRWKVASATAD